MKYAPLIVLAVAQLVLNVILSYKRHDRVTRIFTYFTLLLLLWTSINIALDYLTTHAVLQATFETRLLPINLLNALGFMTGSVLLIVIYQSFILSQGIEKPRKNKLILVLGTFLAIVSALPLVSGSYYVNEPRSGYGYHYGVGSLLFVVYLGIIGWETIRVGIKKLRSNIPPIERKRTVTLLAALFLSAAWGLVFIILIPIITRDDSYIFVGYLAPYIFTILMYYGIIWLGLLNFRQIIARSIGYLLSIIALSFVFIMAIQLAVRYIIREDIPTGEAVLFAAMSFVTALIFQPVKKYFDKFTNKIFYRDAYDSERLFNQLSRNLVGAYDINRLLRTITKLLSEELKLNHVTIQLKNHHAVAWPNNKINEIGPSLSSVVEGIEMHQVRHATKYIIDETSLLNEGPIIKDLFAANDVAALVWLGSPEKNNESALGCVAFGAKRSGNMYTRQDLVVLQAVTNEVALAIQNALHYEEIQNFNITLQQKVDEATRKLRITNEKLKKLDETKDEFISMASHQLRTPLTSVKGYLSMVLEGDAGKLNEQQSDLLKQSFLSSERMVNLIADLLNLSRLNTGKFVIDTRPTDLRKVVSEELAQLSEAAKAKGLTLTYKEPTTFPVLELDENKIHQVVMNFIDNAIYYTPQGGEITIHLIETPTAIEYRVEDNGIGVPRQMQPHLFTKFYRAENAKRMRPDGTGLGLFMAKKVVIAQGGVVLFESEEGKGSMFGFRFPKPATPKQPEPIATQ